MSDPSLNLLYQRIDASPQAGSLLLADEHCIAPPSRHLPVVTNRVDVAERFRQAGFTVALEDFLLDGVSASTVFYRVSKEKALVHHLLNRVLTLLPLGGQLVLSGEKGDGLKTYADKARAMVGSDKNVSKGSGGSLLTVIRKNHAPSTLLDDSDYQRIRPITSDAPVLHSKPGIYGWQKIDRGSALLVRALEGLPEAPATILDLGCGYGFLTVMAHQHFPSAHFLATDNNVTALAACRRNVEVHGIAAELVAADCAAGIAQRVDLVICNPPFHKGFDIHGDLTQAFVSAAAERLVPGGRALFVVNQFIALEQKSAPWFSRCEQLFSEGGFKVCSLQF